MTPEQYLETEFRRYFPDASDVTVDFDNDSETIHVHITTSTGEPDHSRLNSWVMEIGSDDSWYTFRPVVELSYENVLTIPFNPEAED